MAGTSFSESGYGGGKRQALTPPESPTKAQAPAKPLTHGHGHKKTDSSSSFSHVLEHHITVPRPSTPSNTIEVPAIRSPDAHAEQYMNALSASPSMKERRVSRNSFGASLPIPRTKRKSSLSSVTFADVKDALADAPSSSSGIAQPTRTILASRVQDIFKDQVAAAKNMAFVFDIDGVLVHGDRLIPEGKRVLDMLNGNNQLGIKIPHIFLTNGSGKPEAARTEQLSRILGNPVSTDQFIQSHTPMRALAEYYKTVLVVGGEGDRCRDVAEEYGFADIITPADIVAWDPSIAPYLTCAVVSTRPRRDFSQINIEAILVFSDSRDYATDMQVIVDLLLSENCRLGTAAKDPVSQRIPIYFS
ncbi:hypothetical protein MFIFM68171_02093 [Madurella fahalii]|uniref:Uncharacterized protein n=1 Tax=Madurella fahalii TaxID=1157608 RepID=A0ABQ0G292_9PEZI